MPGVDVQNGDYIISVDGVDLQHRYLPIVCLKIKQIDKSDCSVKCRWSSTRQVVVMPIEKKRAFAHP